MTRDEHKAIVTELMGLGSAEHQARISELLTNLSDDYEKTLTESETLTKNNETLTNNNEKLRQVNADLFLRVGNSTHDKKETDKPDNDTIADVPQLTYESLFDEKGVLK